MKRRSHEHIVQRIENGDNTALEDLVIAYKNYCVHGLMNKTKCTKPEAEDLFIEALLELREKIITGKLDTILNMKGYIFGICYNMWLTEQRTNQRRLIRGREAEVYYEQYMEEDILISQMDGAMGYQDELLRATRAALEKLDEKCRKIITYFYLERQSMTEIASRIGFSNADVAKTSKSRCLKKLVEEINKKNIHQT